MLFGEGVVAESVDNIDAEGRCIPQELLCGGVHQRE